MNPSLSRPNLTIFALAALFVVPVFYSLSALAESPAAPATERAPWVLGKGEQRALRVPGLLKYSLGSDCLRGRSQGDTLLLKGVCPGSADLWISKQDGTSEHRSVRIEKTAPGELSPQLERALGHLEEAEVPLAGGAVVLRGEIRTIVESARIRALSEKFPKEIHNETEPAEELMGPAKGKIEEWIRATPYASGLKLERQGRMLFIRGSLARPALQLAAEKKLRSLLPSAVIELDSMPDTAPTVYFRVFLLELKKSRFQTLGISWPEVQEGAFRIAPGAITNALALDLALQAMEGEGSARLLSNPELVVRAPGEAELFAGGELPIKLRSSRASTMMWKNFGLTLQLKVSHTSGEKVRLDVFTEVSHLDQSIGLGDVPGIRANRMKTQVDARYGEPLLLSGLLQQEMHEHARGLPALRSLPILGKLFGSEDYLNQRSELVAILLPASAPPPSPFDRHGRHSRHAPRGPAPIPRDWVSPEKERALRESSEWPWNALQ